AALAASAEPVPYSSLASGARPSQSDPGTEPVYGSEASKLHEALQAARGGDTDRAKAVQAALADPLARRIVTWAMVD
ncbi:hypothetical protein ABTE72_19865, partial [Acinetobacter baumannii]